MGFIVKFTHDRQKKAYKSRIILRCSIASKRTKDSLEILKNPKEFYRKSAIKLVETPDKNDLHTSQKCLVSPTNLSAIHIANPASSQGLQEHRNSIEEDKNSSYAKSLLSSKKEKK